MSLNNIVAKYGLGESVGIKIKPEPKNRTAIMKDIVAYKESHISYESARMKDTINSLITFKKGVGESVALGENKFTDSVAKMWAKFMLWFKNIIAWFRRKKLEGFKKKIDILKKKATEGKFQLARNTTTPIKLFVITSKDNQDSNSFAVATDLANSAYYKKNIKIIETKRKQMAKISDAVVTKDASELQKVFEEYRVGADDFLDSKMSEVEFKVFPDLNAYKAYLTLIEKALYAYIETQENLNAIYNKLEKIQQKGKEDPQSLMNVLTKIIKDEQSSYLGVLVTIYHLMNLFKVDPDLHQKMKKIKPKKQKPTK